MCHDRQAKAAQPRSMDVPGVEELDRLRLKGERFTPKAGHDPDIVSPEAGSRFCAERTPRHPRAHRTGLAGRGHVSVRRSECVTCRHWAGLTSRRLDARLREGMRRASWLLRSLPTSLATEPERQPRMTPIDAHPRELTGSPLRLGRACGVTPTPD